MPERTQLWKGILEGCILVEIGRHPTYGYGILEYLRQNGFSGLSEGTVYPLLQRLEKQGFLTAELKTSEIGPQRKYYSLSESGKACAASFVEAWKHLDGAVNKIVVTEPAGKNPAGDTLLTRPGVKKKKRGFASREDSGKI